MIKLTKKSDFKDGMIVVHRFNENINGFTCAGCIQKVRVNRHTGSVKLFRYIKNGNNSCKIPIGACCHDLDLRSFAYAARDEVVTGTLTIGDI